MKDKNLESRMLKTLLRFEMQNDELSDTPKRHEISEVIINLRSFIKANPSPGYE